MAVSQIDPLAACVDADTFCVGVVNLVHILVYRVGIRYRSPISGGIGGWVVKQYTPSP